jgi:uncharacterized protein (TIGR02145 family)
MTILNGCKEERDQIGLPIVVTSSVFEITSNSVIVSGLITSDGGTEIQECGFFWSTSPNPTEEDNKKLTVTDTGAFSSLITGLTPNTTYHVRAYATNSEGIRYGETLSFTTNQATEGLPATLSTMDISSVTTTTAVSGGIITEFGTGQIIVSGVCWSTAEYPTVNDNKTIQEGSEVFTSTLTNLLPNVTYYVRAYATNNYGTAYGNQIYFTTNRSISDSTVPIVMTVSVTEITVASAVIGSVINSDGGQAIIDKGICWATTPDPTTSNRRTSWGIGTETFPDIIYGLIPETKYYVRAYAVNAVGTGYGDVLSFTTLPISPIVFKSDYPYNSVSDADGNLYKTIQIGTQIWMAENLRTTKLNDGTSIPQVTDDAEWQNLKTSGYCWYDNNPSSFKDTYGALYNWYAVNTGKLCPIGWHVPSNAEWKILSDYLGVDAGDKMKEEGTTRWVDSNLGASNISGFTAIPGGSRDPFYQEWRYSTFGYLGYNSSWWSATENDALIANAAWLYNNVSYFSSSITALKVAGLSIRCLKDSE